MKHIKLAKHQEICLIAKEGSTPAQAILKAIEFCKENKTEGCTLVYSGFTFGIEPDSNIDELVSDYDYWRSLHPL